MKSKTLLKTQLLKSITKLLPLFFAILYSCSKPANTAQDPEEQQYTPPSPTVTEGERIKNILKQDIPNLCYESPENIDFDLIKELNCQNESEMIEDFKTWAQEIQNSLLINEKKVETQTRNSSAKNSGVIREYSYKGQDDSCKDKSYLCYFNEKEECTGFAMYYNTCNEEKMYLDFIKAQPYYTNFSELSSGYIQIMVVKKSARGNGISKAMIEYIHDSFRQKKLKYSTLYTYNKEEETTAHKLYISTGYKNVIDWSSYYSNHKKNKNDNEVPYEENEYKDKTYMVKKL